MPRQSDQADILSRNPFSMTIAFVYVLSIAIRYQTKLEEWDKLVSCLKVTVLKLRLTINKFALAPP